AIASALFLPLGPPWGFSGVDRHAWLAAVFDRARQRRGGLVTAAALMSHSRYSVSAGADAPKPVMPTNSPPSPSHRAQSPSTAASTPTLGTRPRTAVLYSRDCWRNKSKQGADTTAARTLMLASTSA